MGLGDRFNPILVKEVRQALRGKAFRWMFLITLLTATVVGVGYVSLQEDPNGRTFFIPMYGCLSAAIHVFVPLSIFTSLGNEWDENTYDLLVISNLRPRQIALGKLLSAGVQVLLYYSAFGPYLVFAYLLRGVDLVAVGVILGGSLFTSAALASIALALSSLSRLKVLRILFMALVAGGSIQSLGGSIAAASGIINFSNALRDPEAKTAIAAFLTGMVFLVLTGLAVATTRMAHPEENRSTSLRVLLVAALLAGLGWVTYFASWIPTSPSDLLLVIPMMAMLSAGALFVGSIFFASEEERLGRRVALSVPKNPVLALLVAPLLPGGGRAWALLLAGSAGVVAAAWGIRVWAATGDPFPTRGEQALLLGLMYGIFYVGLPSGVLSLWSKHLRVRVMARLAVPLLALLTLLGPAIVGLFSGNHDLMDLEHVLNPAYQIERLLDGEDVGSTLWFMATLAGAVILLNTPRTFVAFREVLAASARRRARHGTDQPSARAEARIAAE